MAVQSGPLPEDAKIEPKSTHVQDAALQPFLQSRFDAADYLNATLPSLTFGNPSKDRVSLADMSTQTQTLMSQLNAQTSRLTSTLNQLTDDMLRSGTRLAYQVDLLRGETAGLSDALNESLQHDMSLFAPADHNDPEHAAPDQIATPTEPDYIEKLRTLAKVRQRLDSVVKVFGDAMAWPVAPSELVTSSFISVSAPSAGGPEEARNREEKGKEHTQELRAEISDLLQSAVSVEEGIDAAIKRIDELRDLATVWKGTAEEKARLRLIDSLAKSVEDEQKALSRKADTRRRTASPAAMDYRYGGSPDPARQSTQGGGGYGFIRNLQRIKDDIYIE